MENDRICKDEKFKTTRESLDIQLNGPSQNLEVISWEELLYLISNFYKKKGYKVEKTEKAEFGADILVTLEGFERVVILINRPNGLTPLSVVHEASTAKIYYKSDRSEVISTGFFSKQSELLAKAIDVNLINRNELEKIIENY